MSKKAYRKNAETIFREEGDEGIVFNPETSEILVLNTTACFIWHLCDGRHTIQDIVAALRGDFEVSEENALRDINHFFVQLEKKKFLESAS
jgi:hypothetical protein